MSTLKFRKRWVVASLLLVAVFLSWHVLSGVLVRRLEVAYERQISTALYDRSGRMIQIEPNERGYYDRFLDTVPARFEEFLLKKEDRFFYFHPGFNPASWLRDSYSWLTTGRRRGSSTLTQQLVKTLLANETERTWTNKLEELLYTFGLEWRKSKDEILLMYANSAYFGNLAQGVEEASRKYFDSSSEGLNDAQTFSLLATLNNPSRNHPLADGNADRAKSLAQAFEIDVAAAEWETLSVTVEGKRRTDLAFEVQSMDLDCAGVCRLTLDLELSQNIREILNRNLSQSSFDSAANGAVVVFKLPENEVLAVIGSPDPGSPLFGRQVNMALKPRATGSTIKPFIYLKGFEKGARPYSLVDDSEIKYRIGSGFDFYPKNFDGQYRGLVTLHQALSNSLNIPSVRMLEFVGLENFYRFLRNDLNFKPLQALENYELGIALGGLEMDLFTLSSYFTLFPQRGILKPLRIFQDGAAVTPYFPPPMAKLPATSQQVGINSAIQMVEKILSDRTTGVDQFGLKSNLNLPFSNYAVKTGTSRDYHDSWTIGFTPDFLVGVWIGNSDNSAMQQVTGLSGAAKVWREVMQVLYNSPYNKHTSFSFDQIEEYRVGDSLDYGLKNDDYETLRQILLRENLIITPHADDKFLLQESTAIPLEAEQEVDWLIDGKFFIRAQKTSWSPKTSGVYLIEAVKPDGTKEQVRISLNAE